MRILLVQHARENTASYPLGLATIASVLAETGHRVSFIDLAFTRSPAKKLNDTIETFRPHALGFTLWTTQYSKFLSLVDDCPAARRIPVVAGGPHAGVAAEEILRDGRVRVVVRGEGELIAARVFEALQNGKGLSNIDGIAFLDEAGAYVQTPEVDYFENLDELPSPPYGLFRVTRYRNRLRGLPVVDMMTSRGCPYSCGFCYRGPTGGRKVRFMSPKRVLAEMERLYRNFGFRAFFFVDDIFTLRRERIIEICELIIASRRRFYWACQTRVDRVDFELLALMKRAGCISIHFGVESGSQRIVDKLDKKTTVEQTMTAIADCQRLRIPTMVYFMLGTPWDTPETKRQTIALAKQLKSTVTLFFAATPFPGTKLRDAFIENGMYVPKAAAEYRQFWVEGEIDAESDLPSSSTQLNKTRRACIEATQEIIWAQILDIRSYPRLLAEFFTQYGLTDFARLAARRILLLR
ncbi:MAG: radical SAM protein [Deltaproteobacteria bacterium]|nr:radical SAM protein [Deltaproteobacteria bacterium]